MTVQNRNNTTISNCNSNPIQQLVGEIQRQGSSIVKTNDNFDEKIQELSEFQKAELIRFKNDTTLKTVLTWFVIVFSTLWSVSIMVLLYLIAFNKCSLSDKVTITLLTETLFLVIGLPMVVTSHFFPKKENNVLAIRD